MIGAVILGRLAGWGADAVFVVVMIPLVTQLAGCPHVPAVAAAVDDIALLLADAMITTFKGFTGEMARGTIITGTEGEKKYDKGENNHFHWAPALFGRRVRCPWNGHTGIMNRNYLRPLFLRSGSMLGSAPRNFL